MFKAKIKSVSVEISGDFDMQYVLGLNDFPPRYKGIDVTFKVVSDDSMRKMEKILEHVERTCGVGVSLHSEISKRFAIDLGPE